MPWTMDASGGMASVARVGLVHGCACSLSLRNLPCPALPCLGLGLHFCAPVGLHDVCAYVRACACVCVCRQQGLKPPRLTGVDGPDISAWWAGHRDALLPAIGDFAADVVDPGGWVGGWV